MTPTIQINAAKIKITCWLEFSAENNAMTPKAIARMRNTSKIFLPLSKSETNGFIQSVPFLPLVVNYTNYIIRERHFQQNFGIIYQDFHFTIMKHFLDYF